MLTIGVHVHIHVVILVVVAEKLAACAPEKTSPVCGQGGGYESLPSQVH